MKHNKAPRTSDLNSNVLKMGGEVVLEQLTKELMATKESPAEWKDSITLTLYKGN